MPAYEGSACSIHCEVNLVGILALMGGVVLEKVPRNAAQSPGQVLYYRWEKREGRGECVRGEQRWGGDKHGGLR